MAQVMTAGGSVSCPHSGAVTLSSAQSKLKAGGALVLVDGDLTLKAIAGCTNVDNTNTGALQCKQTGPQTTGMATKLFVQGKAALLVTVEGPTLSAPGVPAVDPALAPLGPEYSAASAGQSKLEAS